MCEDLEQAEVWRESTPKASKDYRCSICGHPIRRGVRHTAVTSMLDGVWSTERAHTPCVYLSRHIQLDLCRQSVWTMTPELPLIDSVREHKSPDLVRRYRETRRANEREVLR